NPLEPARLKFENLLKAKQGQLRAWWTRLRPKLEQYVLAGGNGQANDRAVAETDALLVSLKSQEQALKDKLDQMKVLTRNAGRVADPDELSSRIHVQILGVVPPLPALQSSGGLLVRRDELRMRRQLDEFVQSLDHLRVVLCARPDRYGRDRHCVLITSACGSE